MRRKQTAPAFLTGLAAAALALPTACGGSDDKPAPRAPSEIDIPLCAGSDLGPAPLRRLTRFEYGRTLSDLLGADPAVAEALPPDEESLGFDDIASAYSVSSLHAARYLDVAEEQGAALVADPARASAFAGCNPMDGDGACVDAFIAAFGRRAWRRPLDAGEQAAMKAVYQQTADPAPADGVAGAVAAMLQAPQFLYRPEPPASGIPSPQPLASHALASRLAYMLWGAAPDQALLDAADAGRLEGEAGLLAETDRLLADPRAADVFAHFAAEWWELGTLPDMEKDRSLFRTWNDGLPAAMGEETRRFLVGAWQEGGTMATLLTAPVTYADAGLAAFYGVAAPPSGQSGFARIDLDPARASGMLTQGAFLSTHAKADQTSPVLRGKFVRARLFCTPPSPPPPEVVVRPPAVDPRLSTRQRFAQHTADSTCAMCHQFMDPIGFGFEHFDATGRWRDLDAGMAVDATGELSVTDVDGTFDGVAELGRKLAGSAQVSGCAATQWFRYAFGRSEETQGDLCTIETLGQVLARPGSNFRELVRATVRMPAFRTRPMEVAP